MGMHQLLYQSIKLLLRKLFNFCPGCTVNNNDAQTNPDQNNSKVYTFSSRCYRHKKLLYGFGVGVEIEKQEK